MVVACSFSGDGADTRVRGLGRRRWVQDGEIVEGADDAVTRIFNRRDDAAGIAAQVPPLVGADAVATGVGAGPDGGVARSCLGVGVVVVAGVEVGTLLEVEVEAVGGGKEIAIAVDEVRTQLVNDQDDDDLRPGVVGICVSRR